MAILTKGNLAPDFKGLNQLGKEISLSSFRGKKVILYFYPKDNTPGCTAEACDLNNNYEMWLSMGYEIIGVSPDSVVSHLKFAGKFGLNFNLIADTGLEILKDFGVWGEKSMYGKTYMGVLRTTFVLDENGIIVDVFEKVNTKEHTKQILGTV